MRRFAGVLAVTLALAVPSRTAAAAPAPGPTAPTGANLIVNPGAEVGLCTTSGYDAMTVPGWSVTEGAADSVCYGAVGFPRPDVPGPITRGRAFFSGGATGDAAMTQRIDVSAAAAAIDRGHVAYGLSGWLGGFAGQNDRATLSASFLGAKGVLLQTTSVFPVTNTDRHNVTGLTFRSVAGNLARGTRAITVTVSFVWTQGDTTDGYADNLSFGIGARVPAPRLVAPASNVPRFDHVFFVFMENENALDAEAPAGSGGYILDNPAAPYLNHTLGVEGSLLTEAYATTHPSDPNYLAITGGSTFGWTSNPRIGVDTVDARHLGDLLDAAGLTWRGYADGAAAPCDLTEHNDRAGGYYLPDDDPFLLYRDVVTDPRRCAEHTAPLTTLGDDLASGRTTPAFVWFAANDVDNMEGGGVAAGDRWLHRTLPVIFNSEAWTGARSLLIISWDEGHTKAYGPDYPNHVATYVLASQDMVKPGYASKIRYTDYSLGRTIEEALGLGPLTSNDRYAVPLGDVWTGRGGGPGGSGSSNMSLRISGEH